MELILEVDGKVMVKLPLRWPLPDESKTKLQNFEQREAYLQIKISALQKERLKFFNKGYATKIYFSAISKFPQTVSTYNYRKPTRERPTVVSEWSGKPTRYKGKPKPYLKIERTPLPEEPKIPFVREPGVYSNHSHFRIAK